QNTVTQPTNRHPVDELADVRAERRRLEEREAELRNILLAHGADLDGDDYQARILHRHYPRLNYGLVVCRFGEEAAAECCKTAEATTIKLGKKRRSGAQK